jgi:carboxylate-amine ligase
LKVAPKLSIYDHKYGSSKEFTIGIEEEFQLIDREDFSLVSVVEEIFAHAPEDLLPRLQHELIQAEIEINTGICENISEARADIISTRKRIRELVEKRGYLLAATGTHPFSRWQDQKITEKPYYLRLVGELQWWARQNNSFGQHVHIGIGNPEKAIQIINALRSYVPHLLALSTNSPFWQGEATGLKSTRAQIFNGSFLRKGIPPVFKSWSEYIEFEDTLEQTNCIRERREIWWDVRPNRTYGTIEMRICDVQMRVDESIALAALVQALIRRLSKMYEEGRELLVEQKGLIDENKWRAMRYGLVGRLIEPSTKSESLITDSLKRLFEWLEDEIEELGSAREFAYLENRLSERVTGADRQLELYARNKDFPELMHYVVEESFGSL